MPDDSAWPLSSLSFLLPLAPLCNVNVVSTLAPSFSLSFLDNRHPLHAHTSPLNPSRLPRNRVAQTQPATLSVLSILHLLVLPSTQLNNMAPSCVVDPMDCIFEKRSLGPALYKRAPTDAGESGESNKQAVIIAATVGSLLLVILFLVFFYCVRKRRASRGIGQLQRFLPTFMDQEKTEQYFQKHGSSTTLVGTAPPTKDGKELSQPTNAHQRTRSVPVAFAKGVTDHRNRHIERDGSVGQFQQISLTSEEIVLERDGSIKKSPSGRSTRTRSATVTAPPPAMSSLHRGVSLNKHGAQGSSGSRSDLPEEEEGEQHDKFADGESLVAPNRLSVLLDFDQANKSNRFSATSIAEDPNFDTRFSSSSVMFDAKRISQTSGSSDDESSKSSADEFRNNLPPHQHPPSFHSRDVSIETPLPATQPSFVGGDKQELEDDDDVVLQPTVGNQAYSRPDSYPSMPQNASMPTQMPPMHMPMPVHMQVQTPVPGSASPPIPKRPLLPSQQKQMLTARPASSNNQDLYRY